MTTAADVSTVWAAVFADSSMTAITANAFSYAIAPDSEFELSSLESGQSVNFFQYTTVRNQAVQMIHAEEHTFRVTVEYTLEKDPVGANYNAVRTAFETLYAAVKSVLGNTWTSTVDYWRLIEDISNPEEVTIASTQCWRARAVYLGTKRESV
jgi:hypothetical protein